MAYNEKEQRIATNLQDLVTAQGELATAITNKGVDVPAGTRIKNLPPYVDQIERADPIRYADITALIDQGNISGALDAYLAKPQEELISCAELDRIRDVLIAGAWGDYDDATHTTAGFAPEDFQKLFFDGYKVHDLFASAFAVAGFGENSHRERIATAMTHILHMGLNSTLVRDEINRAAITCLQKYTRAIDEQFAMYDGPDLLSEPPRTITPIMTDQVPGGESGTRIKRIGYIDEYTFIGDSYEPGRNCVSALMLKIKATQDGNDPHPVINVGNYQEDPRYMFSAPINLLDPRDAGYSSLQTWALFIGINPTIEILNSSGKACNFMDIEARWRCYEVGDLNENHSENPF